MTLKQNSALLPVAERTKEMEPTAHIAAMQLTPPFRTQRIGTEPLARAAAAHIVPPVASIAGHEDRTSFRIGISTDPCAAKFEQSFDTPAPLISVSINYHGYTDCNSSFSCVFPHPCRPQPSLQRRPTKINEAVTHCIAVDPTRIAQRSGTCNPKCARTLLFPTCL